MTCNNLKQLLEAEKLIIEHHIDKHKFYRGISNRDEGIQDFINNYAEIIRESFCLACKFNESCEYYLNYFPLTK